MSSIASLPVLGRAAALSLGTLLGSTLLGGCSEPAPPPAIEVGGLAYTEAELGALTTAEREQLADLTAFGILVSRGELARLAEPFGERQAQSRLLRKLTLEVAAREAGYDQEKLQTAYAAAPEYELVVRHLVILSERWRPEEHRRAARERAAEVLREIRRGADFARVAGEYSEEPGASRRGGLLEAGRRGTWVAEFWDAASALAPGGVSEVVETPYGFHVLRLEERHAIPLAEVRNLVLARLVDMSSAASSADAWAARRSEGLQLAEERALAWRAGEEPDSVVIASWPDGAYRGTDLQRYLLTLEAEASERLAAADASAYLEVVRALARNALLAQGAASLGVSLTAAERAELMQPQLTRFQGLAAALNFRRGAQPDQIKAAALQALAPGSQRALIARGELLEAAPALKHFYPPRFSAPQP